ncbi:hypothetical protein, partial [Streptomyces sp. NPDC047009]|uniref:hypothetical protein n=1 Tax=Streptomyces sp. NPDC047009 TaxID=3154496 RepID=UPI00340DD72B
MKQSAAKTLGVAALGAAFAAAGAGVASAAPAAPAVPNVAGLDTVTQALPVGDLSGIVPGTGEALGQGQNALGGAVAAAQPVSHKLGWRVARAVVTARKSAWVPPASDVDMTLA